MVTICQQCGDKGWDNGFVYCIECLEFAIHRYCLNLIPKTFDEFVPWICEDCEKEMPNQPSLEKPSAISTKKRDGTCLAAEVEEQSCRDGSSQEISKAHIKLAAEAEEQSCRDGSSQEISKAHIKRKYEDAELANCSKKKKCEAHSVGKRHEEGHIIHCSLQAFEAGDCSSVTETVEKLKTHSDLEGRCKLIFNTRSHSDGEVSHLGTVPNIQQDHPVPAEPIKDPVWRGDFSIVNRNQDTCDGFVAHLSNKACAKVHEEARLLKPLLNLEMLPKSDVWPKSFQKSDPSDESIALYFFPANISNERVFDALVENMMSNELALKATVENAELLLFTSTELPLLYWRFQEKYYLWGVFRGKQAAGSQSQMKKSDNGARSLDPAKDEGTAVERKLRKPWFQQHLAGGNPMKHTMSWPNVPVEAKEEMKRLLEKRALRVKGTQVEEINEKFQDLQVPLTVSTELSRQNSAEPSESSPFGDQLNPTGSSQMENNMNHYPASSLQHSGSIEELQAAKDKNVAHSTTRPLAMKHAPNIQETTVTQLEEAVADNLLLGDQEETNSTPQFDCKNRATSMFNMEAAFNEVVDSGKNGLADKSIPQKGPYSVP